MRKIHERLLGVVKEQSNQRIREAKQMRLNRLKKSKKQELPPVLEFLIKTELTTQSLSALKWLNPEIDNQDELIKKYLYLLTQNVPTQVLFNLCSTLGEQAEAKERECESLYSSLDEQQ